ncbi:MAG: type II toxin-antitoxin system Phd/YefM family antitoxin [Saccharofermentanales bacterium]
MYVTATDFKLNFGKYLEIISKEDVFITKNGKTIAKLVNPTASVVDELRGIISIPKEIEVNKEYIRNARLARHENTD